MGIAIRNYYRKPADQIIADDTLISVGLSSPIAKNEVQKLRWWIAAIVGATGGFQCNVVIPLGAQIKTNTLKLFDPENNAIHIAQVPNISLALAGSGSPWLELEIVVENGNLAGIVDLVCAQHATDALTLTIQQDSTLDVTKG